MVSISFGSTLQSNSSILSGAFGVYNWWFGLPSKNGEGSRKGLPEIVGRAPPRPPKINMSPEKEPIQKENSLPTNMLVFRGICDMYDRRSQVLVLSQCATSSFMFTFLLQYSCCETFSTSVARNLLLWVLINCLKFEYERSWLFATKKTIGCVYKNTIFSNKKNWGSLPCSEKVRSLPAWRCGRWWPICLLASSWSTSVAIIAAVRSVDPIGNPVLTANSFNIPRWCSLLFLCNVGFSSGESPDFVDNKIFFGGLRFNTLWFCGGSLARIGYWMFERTIHDTFFKCVFDMHVAYDIHAPASNWICFRKRWALHFNKTFHQISQKTKHPASNTTIIDFLDAMETWDHGPWK